MTPAEKRHIERIIRKVAKKQNTTVPECRAAMQEALDEAWAAAWTPGNLRAQVAWQRLFPGGRKPTVEEFIAATSRTLRE